MSDSGHKLENGLLSEDGGKQEAEIHQGPPNEDHDLPWIPTVVPSLTRTFTVQVVHQDFEQELAAEPERSGRLMAAEGDFEEEEDHPFELSPAQDLVFSTKQPASSKVTREVPTTSVLQGLGFAPENLLGSDSGSHFALQREAGAHEGLRTVLPELLIPEAEVENIATSPEVAIVGSKELVLESGRQTSSVTVEEPMVFSEGNENLSYESIDLEETHHEFEGRVDKELLSYINEEDCEDVPQDDFVDAAKPMENTLEGIQQQDISEEESGFIDLEETHTQLASFELDFSSVEQEVLTISEEVELPDSRPLLTPSSKENGSPLEPGVTSLEAKEGFVHAQNQDRVSRNKAQPPTTDFYTTNQVLLEVDSTAFLPYEGLAEVDGSEPSSADFERVSPSRQLMTRTSDFSASQAELLNAENAFLSSEVDFYPIELLRQSDSLESMERESDLPVLSMDSIVVGQAEDAIEVLSHSSQDESETIPFGLDDDDEQPIIDLQPSMTLASVTSEKPTSFLSESEEPSSSQSSSSSEEKLLGGEAAIPLLEEPGQEPLFEKAEHTLEAKEVSIEEDPPLSPGTRQTVGERENLRLIEVQEPSGFVSEEKRDGGEVLLGSSDSSGEVVTLPVVDSEAGLLAMDFGVPQQEERHAQKVVSSSFLTSPSSEELPRLTPEFAGVAAQQSLGELDSPAQLSSTLADENIQLEMTNNQGESSEANYAEPFVELPLRQSSEEEEPLVLLTSESMTSPAFQSEGLLEGPSVLLTREHAISPEARAHSQAPSVKKAEWPGWWEQARKEEESWEESYPPAVFDAMTGHYSRALNYSEEQALHLLTQLQVYAARAAIFVVRDQAVVGLFGVGEHDLPKRIQQVFLPLRVPSVFSSVADVRLGYQGPLSRRLVDRVLASCLGPLPNQLLVYPVMRNSKVVAFVYLDDGGGEFFPESSEMVHELLKSAASIDFRNTPPAAWRSLHASPPFVG